MMLEIISGGSLETGLPPCILSNNWRNIWGWLVPFRQKMQDKEKDNLARLKSSSALGIWVLT